MFCCHAGLINLHFPFQIPRCCHRIKHTKAGIMPCLFIFFPHISQPHHYLHISPIIPRRPAPYFNCFLAHSPTTGNSHTLPSLVLNISNNHPINRNAYRIWFNLPKITVWSINNITTSRDPNKARAWYAWNLTRLSFSRNNTNNPETQPIYGNTPVAYANIETVFIGIRKLELTSVVSFGSAWSIWSIFIYCPKFVLQCKPYSHNSRLTAKNFILLTILTFIKLLILHSSFIIISIIWTHSPKFSSSKSPPEEDT